MKTFGIFVGMLVTFGLGYLLARGAAAQPHADAITSQVFIRG